ncbi:hypothetical protein VNO78_00317 [Psophocarpus tetragonolobus]|uniref:Uncharacterized protein n=1 Tax=Psophocarpus tetragonolobus TaxID=3891 RepID=A0AAN9T7P0_PSOTE
MFENHVTEQVSEADLDYGHGLVHEQSNVDTESNTDTYQYQSHSNELGNGVGDSYSIGTNRQISLEKDQIVNMLVDLCGSNKEDEGNDKISCNTSTIIDLCFHIIKGQSGPYFRASNVDVELFERIQSLLYVRDQD